MSRRNRHKKKKLQKLRRSVMSESRPQAPTLSVRDPDRSIGASGKISQFAPAVEATTDATLEAKETPAEITAAPKPAAQPEESESIIDAPTRKLIAKDVRMIIFTLFGLAVILTVAKILSLKTGYIDSFGNWLYKITNIQTM